jgi:NTP pyrophosphatase (non-canonical NTP hydrolase)
VTFQVLNLSLALDIDLSDAFAAKMAKNAQKYPAGA